MGIENENGDKHVDEGQRTKRGQNAWKGHSEKKRKGVDEESGRRVVSGIAS